MNLYRLCGDMSHAVAIILLILQLWKSKNSRGISIKTQELYLLVYVTRYLDLFTTFYSVYNSTMKILFISTTTYIICMVKYREPYKSLYNRDQDPFHIMFAVAPCAALALITNVVIPLAFSVYYGDLMQLLWTFSIYLESVAILPQLVVLHRYRLVENLTGKFMFCLGSYRLLYIFNWTYRSYTEPHYRHHYVVYACGIVQTLLYTNFLYQYYKVFCCYNKRNEDNNADEDDTGLLFEQELSNQAERQINNTSINDPLMQSLSDKTDEGTKKRSITKNEDRDKDILVV